MNRVEPSNHIYLAAKQFYEAGTVICQVSKEGPEGLHLPWDLKYVKEYSIQQRRVFARGFCRGEQRFGCYRNLAVSVARFESCFRERSGKASTDTARILT